MNLIYSAFISHSASRENLAYAFRNLLPDLSGKHLLDVGSRFGAVLFGAFAFSQATRITGVEINPELASLSLSMVHKYNMQVCKNAKYLYALYQLLKYFIYDSREWKSLQEIYVYFLIWSHLRMLW